MADIQFGTGNLYMIPNSGNLAANPTPIELGVLQEVSIEFKADLKKLFGQRQFAVATARGKIDVTGKGKFASQDINALNQIYFGQASANGSRHLFSDEQHVPGTSVAVAGAGSNFVQDYGVINNGTGVNMTYTVSGTPAIGQYTQTAGTYVFNAAETAPSVAISYLTTATTGTTITLQNQLMGYAPQFGAFFYNKFRGQYFALQLNNCTMGMYSLPSKQEDFWVQDFDFSANCDAANVLGYMYQDAF